MAPFAQSRQLTDAVLAVLLALDAQDALGVDALGALTAQQSIVTTMRMSTERFAIPSAAMDITRSVAACVLLIVRLTLAPTLACRARRRATVALQGTDEMRPKRTRGRSSLLRAVQKRLLRRGACLLEQLPRQLTLSAEVHSVAATRACAQEDHRPCNQATHRCRKGDFRR